MACPVIKNDFPNLFSKTFRK